MAAMAATIPEISQLSSPKRKRDAEDPTSPTRLDTNLTFPSTTFTEVALQGEDSPRTAVAEDLEQLKLQGKGRGKTGGSKPTDVEVKARKRVKMRSAAAKTRRSGVAIALRPKDSKAPAQNDAVDNTRISPSSDSSGNGIHTKAANFEKPSITSSLISKTKTRLKSPPLSSNKNSGKEPQEMLDVEDDGDGEDEDLRSNLTWRDDEITGMDLNDPDDDGEGVNGIGYTPTPAQAYARTEKRKQQIMEYRSREANEARKRRMERRSRLATPVRGGGGTKSWTIKKVRFADSQAG
ncbi:MAG: hypothetical protein M1839_007275 [Geoglossum umbratile]|nr:MAG: hypothetical protein M1839_007275 [Geoglossum umbratile]